MGMNQPALGMDEREFLMSEAYRKYLERVVRTVSGMYDLRVVFSPSIQTDGQVIHINPLSPLLAPLATLEQKTLAILGQLAHEYFHIAYTDFRAFRLLPAKMRQETPFRREMAYRLLNIVEDAAVERLGCAAYRGLFRRALAFSNHVAFSQMPAIDQMQRRGEPAFQVLAQATLMQAVLGKVKGEWLDPTLAAVFAEAVPILEQGKRAPDSMARLRHAEALYRLYLPWIEEMEQSGVGLDPSFQSFKPVWRLSPDRRGVIPAGSWPEAAVPAAEPTANSHKMPETSGEEGGRGRSPGFTERIGSTAALPESDEGNEGDRWRWDEELGYRAARRQDDCDGGPTAEEPGAAAQKQGPRTEPSAGDGPNASAAIRRDDHLSGAASPAIAENKGSDREADGPAAARYRFRWKWFRFGRKRRPQGRLSRQMADADAVQPSRQGEPADFVLPGRRPVRADGVPGGQLHAGQPDETADAVRKGPGDAPADVGSRDVAPDERAPSPAEDPGLEEAAGPSTWEADLAQVAQALVSVQADAVREAKAKAAGQAVAGAMRRHGEHLAVGLHQGIRVFSHRDFSLTPEDREKFLRLEAETRWLAQSMIRQWQQWFLGDQPVRESGLYSGKLDERRLWRQDTRLFYRRSGMDGGSNLAILVLVDESGSMSESSRWHHAQRACLVLEAVCRACRLPLAVMGHLAVYGRPHVVHHHYLDFGPRPADQRERLVLLGPKENTREGLSLRYAAQYIREAERAGWLGTAGQVRPLILSISDGRPVHEADRWTLKGQAAQDDVRGAVRELARDGIHVIGVAIGEEPSAIGEVYPHAVEVRRVEDLPQRLLRTLRQWMETSSGSMG